MTDSIAPVRRHIAESDSAVSAVGKAADAERAMCDRIIAHYRALGVFSQWCLEQSLLDAAAVMLLVRGGFCVGVGGVEPAAPEVLEDVPGRCIAVVSAIERSVSTNLPAARDRLLSLAATDPLLAKSEAVVSERSSVRSAQLIDVEVRAFVAALASTMFGDVFLSTRPTWWGHFIEE